MRGALLAVVRASFAAVSTLHTVAHIQRESSTRDTQRATPSLQDPVVVVHGGVGRRFYVDSCTDLRERRAHVQAGDAVVSRRGIEGEAGEPTIALPSIPDIGDGVQRERVVDRRATADALSAANGHCTVDRRSRSALRVQAGHVPFALIEKVARVVRTLLDKHDRTAGLLAERRGEDAASGTRTDD